MCFNVKIMRQRFSNWTKIESVISKMRQVLARFVNERQERYNVDKMRSRDRYIYIYIVYLIHSLDYDKVRLLYEPFKKFHYCHVYTSACLFFFND